MGKIVMYDVDGMEEVAKNIDNNNQDFEQEYENALGIIRWAREHFTGDVSDKLREVVMENDPYFRELVEILDECNQVLNKSAGYKTENAEALERQIETNNNFEGR